MFKLLLKHYRLNETSGNGFQIVQNRCREQRTKSENDHRLQIEFPFRLERFPRLNESEFPFEQKVKTSVLGERSNFPESLDRLKKPLGRGRRMMTLHAQMTELDPDKSKLHD